MLGYGIPSPHTFLAINIPNSEVEQLHKFEQDPLDLCSPHWIKTKQQCRRDFTVQTIHCTVCACDLDLSFLEHF